MTDDEYRECETQYDQLLASVQKWPEISVVRVQRQFQFGYNRAARLLETLAENGHIHWDSLTGKYSPIKAHDGEGVHRE